MFYTGERVKELRKEFNMSGVELSERIGITNDKLSRRENGFLKFSLLEAYKLSQIFGKSIESIFFNEELQKL